MILVSSVGFYDTPSVYGTACPPPSHVFCPQAFDLPCPWLRSHALPLVAASLLPLSMSFVCFISFLFICCFQGKIRKIFQNLEDQSKGDIQGPFKLLSFLKERTESLEKCLSLRLLLRFVVVSVLKGIISLEAALAWKILPIYFILNETLFLFFPLTLNY